MGQEYDEQIHLSGKRMSQRGVRVRMLPPEEHGAVFDAASKIVTGDDAKVIDLKRKEWRMGVKQFIVAYTEPCKDPTDPAVKWMKADLATLDQHFGELFCAKDVAVLENMYRDFHEISPAEIEAIAGKALPVSPD